MRRFTSDELHEFLEAVDRHLKRQARINVLGGGALMLAYGVDVVTTDIDTFATNMRPLHAAIAKATEETGLRVSVSAAGGAVGDVPYDSDERLIRVMPNLTNLKIYTLEAHDVALSKTLRGYEKDYVAIEKLHDAVGLSKSTLIERYLNEMKDAVGNPDRHDDNFVELIARLFGDEEGLKMADRLRARRRK